MASFDRDLAANGLPTDLTLLGRNIIALNSLGLEDFAFAKLTGLPNEFHHAAWYWEAARLLCFGEHGFSQAHREALFKEAESLHEDDLTAEFRAYDQYNAGDVDGAWNILRKISTNKLSNYTAELLLRIELDRKLPESLTLAQRSDCFDLRNGHHWQYLAVAEGQAGHAEAAAAAWKKAVYYYPDDVELMKAAVVFAAHHEDRELSQAISTSGNIYGRP